MEIESARPAVRLTYLYTKWENIFIKFIALPQQNHAAATTRPPAVNASELHPRCEARAERKSTVKGLHSSS